MRIIFITNLPSPYRADFFRILSSYLTNKDSLSVVFERRYASDRDDAWYGKDALGFHAHFTSDLPVGADMSVGFGMMQTVKRLMRKDSQDGRPLLIFAGYSSPAVILAINYAIRHGLPYYIEFDGTAVYGRNGLLRQLKNMLKKRLLCGANGFFITCKATASMLESFGIPQNKMYKYPFSSIHDSDIQPTSERQARKLSARQKLGITKEQIILAVGRFVQCKGFDILLRAASVMQKRYGKDKNNTALYFVGGEPDAEFIRLRDSLLLENINTVPFVGKSELDIYYDAADVLILPTRHDSWGLVLCEALARGVPVVTTDRCAAAGELICEGKNGFTVPSDDENALAEAIIRALSIDAKAAADVSNKIMSGYTVEQMALRHIEIFEMLKGGADD